MRRLRALQKRQIEATDQMFYPFACLLAQNDCVHGLKRSPEDYMRKRVTGTDGPGIEAYESFMRAANAKR